VANLTIFNIINNIQYKEPLLSPEAIEDIYQPFLLVQYFSFIESCIPIINEISKYETYTYDNYYHYLFLYKNIPKLTNIKYLKWGKKQFEYDSNVLKLSKLYQCNLKHAKSINDILVNTGNIDTVFNFIEDLTKKVTL